MNINENTDLIGFIVWLICSCNLGKTYNEAYEDKKINILDQRMIDVVEKALQEDSNFKLNTLRVLGKVNMITIKN